MMAEDLLASGVSLKDVTNFIIARDEVRDFVSDVSDYDGPPTERDPDPATAPTLPAGR